MSAIDKLFYFPPEVKLMIWHYLSHSDGLALFAVNKALAGCPEQPDFWKHRLLVDFALYTGDKVPPVDFLNRNTIDSINSFFQLYANSSPLIGEFVSKLYQPLPEEDLAQGFYSAYKSTYKKISSFGEYTFVQICWTSFLFTKGTDSKTNEALLELGADQATIIKIIEYSRNCYRFTTVLNLASGTKSAELLLNKCDNAIKQESARRTRKKYLRIFLYAIGGMIFIFASLKLGGIIRSTGIFSKNRLSYSHSR